VDSSDSSGDDMDTDDSSHCDGVSMTGSSGTGGGGARSKKRAASAPPMGVKSGKRRPTVRKGQVRHTVLYEVI
jgi:hypothetical protein